MENIKCSKPPTRLISAREPDFKKSLTKPKIQLALCENYLDLKLRTQYIPRNIKKFACKTSQKVQNDPYSFKFKQLINLSLEFFGEILASLDYL